MIFNENGNGITVRTDLLALITIIFYVVEFDMPAGILDMVFPITGILFKIRRV